MSERAPRQQTMFDRANLASCENRGIRAKKHPHLGEPEEWLSPDLLRRHRLRGVSFDFFVDWGLQPPKVQDELWSKRLPSPSCFPGWETATDDEVRDALLADAAFVALAEFGAAQRRPVVAMMFRQEAGWPSGGVIRTLRLAEDTTMARRPDLETLKARIRTLSGGEVRVGSKGLLLAATTLECHLSRTDAAWPGDADLLITDDDHEPVVLVELKKVTQNTPMSKQRLSNFYSSQRQAPDNRKYNRLAHLCLDLGTANPVPLVVVYYSTRAEVLDVKVERVEGGPNNLREGAIEQILMRPADLAGSLEDLLRVILKLAREGRSPATAADSRDGTLARP